MSSTNESFKSQGGISATQETIFTESASTKARRQNISRAAWNTMSETERTSLDNVAQKLADGDNELHVAYFQAVLVVNYVNQKANINTDPTLLLPPESYRFWY